MSRSDHLPSRASLASQLGNQPCLAKDTEAIFWLRQQDDLQSRIALANALAAEYRYQEAAAVYAQALRISPDDWNLLSRFAGSLMTLGKITEAMRVLRRCLALGADRRKIAYPMGAGHYFQHDFNSAADSFAECLPCDDEQAIAVIYWHALSCYRCNREVTTLNVDLKALKIKHHTAYLLAVSVFFGYCQWEQAVDQLEHLKSDLDFVIAAYGLCGHLDWIGENQKSSEIMKELLDRDTSWPCIAYLAAGMMLAGGLALATSDLFILKTAV